MCVSALRGQVSDCCGSLSWLLRAAGDLLILAVRVRVGKLLCEVRRLAVVVVIVVLGLDANAAVVKQIMPVYYVTPYCSERASATDDTTYTHAVTHTHARRAQHSAHNNAVGACVRVCVCACARACCYRRPLSHLSRRHRSSATLAWWKNRANVPVLWLRPVAVSAPSSPTGLPQSGYTDWPTRRQTITNTSSSATHKQRS